MRKKAFVRYVWYVMALSALNVVALMYMVKAFDYDLVPGILIIFLLDALISIVLSIFIGWDDLKIVSAMMIFVWLIAYLLGYINWGPQSYMLSTAVIMICYPTLALLELRKSIRLLKKEAKV